ncbi:MAG TPA: cyclic nucleotide-binding and patatin-like phospholipase domain-containing protein [Acidimicrobiia bacterium]|nr:cyclic nucleotide-binding and patatin-like phospholipase domain-containing protein [Acidimicrobiia bacterium]
MANEAISRLELSGAFPQLTRDQLIEAAGSSRLVELGAGQPLIIEGSEPSHAFVLVSGALEVTREIGGVPIHLGVIADPGSVVGEVAMLTGGTRNATVRADQASTVVEIERRDFARLLDLDHAAARRISQDAIRRIEETKLATFVAKSFGTHDPGLVAELSRSCDWLRVEGGRVVFNQGDEADAAYVIVSGRVDVTSGHDGDEVRLGELGPGEVFGELGLIDDAPRSATVTTRRDTLLVKFPRPAFELLMDERPKQMIELARTIVRRAAGTARPSRGALVISVAVASESTDRTFVSQLVDQLKRLEPTDHLWPGRVDEILGKAGAAAVELGDPAEARLIRLLQEAELSNSVLVLETPPTQTGWARRAIRQSDRVVVVCPRESGASDRKVVADLLALAPPRARKVIVVVHGSDDPYPSGSARLLSDTGADELIHIRGGSAPDLGRVARLISGRGYGLVLGGGGARGFAHIGVYQALIELGVPIDWVGGSSIGSVFAATIASEFTPDQMISLTEQFFRGVLDYTIPVVSLIKGKRIMKSMDKVWGGIDIEDMWRGFFCMSTNLTRSRAEVHRTGPLAAAVRASVALPGVIPPVPRGGDLLVDGGVLDNLPIAPMRATLPFGTIIAVDVAPAAGPRAKADFGMSVSGWKALMAKSHLQKGMAYPGIIAILLRSTIAGSSAQLASKIQKADLYLDLDLRGTGMLDFDKVRPVVKAGYDAASPRIESWLEALTPGS